MLSMLHYKSSLSSKMYFYYCKFEKKKKIMLTQKKKKKFLKCLTNNWFIILGKTMPFEIKELHFMKSNTCSFLTSWFLYFTNVDNCLKKFCGYGYKHHHLKNNHTWYTSTLTEKYHVLGKLKHHLKALLSLR